jgi:hypothetical protein
MFRIRPFIASGPVWLHDPEKWEPVFREDHAQTRHDPEKWDPVFRKDHAQTKRSDHDPIQSDLIMI